MKRCTRCRELLPVECFGKEAANSDGHRYWCRPCQAAYSRALRARNPERRRAYMRVWVEKNREQQRAAERKWRAAHAAEERIRLRAKTIRRRGLLVELIDRLEVYRRARGICGVCLHQVAPDEDWHVDHIIPLSKGGVHTYANVQPTHALCNMKKGAQLPELAKKEASF